MEKLKELAENLSNLTVLECYQLAKIIKEHLVKEKKRGTRYEL